MSLRRSAIIKILAAVCLLTLCGLPAYAQTADLEQVILNDPTLKEKYGEPCTSINGIEISSLSRHEGSSAEIRRLESGRCIVGQAVYSCCEDWWFCHRKLKS